MIPHKGVFFIGKKAWQSWIRDSLPVRQALLVYARTYGVDNFRAVYRITHSLTPYLAVPARHLDHDDSTLFVEIIVPLHLVLVANLSALRVAVRLEPQRSVCRNHEQLFLIPYANLDKWRVPSAAVSFSSSVTDWPEPGIPGFVVP